MAGTLRPDDEVEALELIREVGRGKADVTQVAQMSASLCLSGLTWSALQLLTSYP